MKNMENVLKILDACGNLNVKTLKINDDGLELSVEFHMPKVEESTKPYVNEVPIDAPLEVSKDFAITEKLREVEQDFDLLALENPLLYEELLAQGKLDEFGELHE